VRGSQKNGMLFFIRKVLYTWKYDRLFTSVKNILNKERGRGGAVVKALRYKPEGRGFDSLRYGPCSPAWRDSLRASNGMCNLYLMS
jgi:hypothetical protein